MNKEEFRLNKEQFLELRSELRKPQLQSNNRFIITASAVALIIVTFLLNPKTEVSSPQLAQPVNKLDDSYNDLVNFEKEFDLRLSEKKQVRKDSERFQRWKKNKPGKLAEKIAGTRLRLNKLKNKINS
jgi:hypothetical protein